MDKENQINEIYIINEQNNENSFESSQLSSSSSSNKKQFVRNFNSPHKTGDITNIEDNVVKIDNFFTQTLNNLFDRLSRINCLQCLFVNKPTTDPEGTNHLENWKEGKKSKPITHIGGHKNKLHNIYSKVVYVCSGCLRKRSKNKHDPSRVFCGNMTAIRFFRSLCALGTMLTVVIFILFLFSLCCYLIGMATTYSIPSVFIIYNFQQSTSTNIVGNVITGLIVILILISILLLFYTCFRCTRRIWKGSTLITTTSNFQESISSDFEIDLQPPIKFDKSNKDISNVRIGTSSENIITNTNNIKDKSEESEELEVLEVLEESEEYLERTKKKKKNFETKII